MSLKKSLVIVILILAIDQISKVYIKTNFVLGESVDVFSWFKILFIENEGAAWGTKLSDLLPISDEIGKLVLTIFRLFAIIGIGYWLFDTIKKNSSKTLILAVSLIFAEPYGSLFHGKVVDMLYFPMIDSVWPDWVPVVGGNNFRFFEPVFNIADTAISTGVGILIVFNKKAFGESSEEVKTNISDQG